MICEKCGCHDRVMRTVTEGQQTVRIRRCISCGHMIRTEEKKMDRPPVRRKKKAATPKKDGAAKGALAQAMAGATD